MPPSLRNLSPAPEQWSAAGVIEHVGVVEARTAHRLLERIALAGTESVSSDTDTDPVLPGLNVQHLLDRTTQFVASETTHPRGLSADAAWAALEHAGSADRDAMRAGDGLALGTLFMAHPRNCSCVAKHGLSRRFLPPFVLND